MTSTDSAAIEMVKNIAFIVTMVAAIFAILVNWKAIFLTRSDSRTSNPWQRGRAR